MKAHPRATDTQRANIDAFNAESVELIHRCLSSGVRIARAATNLPAATQARMPVLQACNEQQKRLAVVYFEAARAFMLNDEDLHTNFVNDPRYIELYDLWKSI
jgi:hypothetical protein